MVRQEARSGHRVFGVEKQRNMAFSRGSLRFGDRERGSGRERDGLGWRLGDWALGWVERAGGLVCGPGADIFSHQASIIRPVAWHVEPEARTIGGETEPVYRTPHRRKSAIFGRIS